MLLPLISDCRLVHMWGWELTSPASTFSNCPSLGELNEPVDRGSIKWYPIHQREKGTKSLCSLWLAAVGLTYCERFQIFLLRVDDRMYNMRLSPSILSPNAVALKISKYTHTTILRGLPNSIGQRLKLDLLPYQVPFSLLFLNSRRCTCLARYTAFVCRHWLDPLRRESNEL